MSARARLARSGIEQGIIDGVAALPTALCRLQGKRRPRLECALLMGALLQPMPPLQRFD
jgi:hypothetical protein